VKLNKKQVKPHRFTIVALAFFMSIIDDLRSLNAATSTQDLAQALTANLGDDQALAIYWPGPTAGALRKVYAFGFLDDECPPLISANDHAAWRAFNISKPVTFKEINAIPIGKTQTIAVLMFRGEAISKRVNDLSADLAHAISRTLKHDELLWYRGILDVLETLTRDGVIGATQDGANILYSDSLQRGLGWTQEDVKKHGWTGLVYPDPQYRTEVMKGLSALLLGKASNGTVRNLTGKDGEERPYAMWSGLGPRLHGGPPVLLGVVEDVSDKLALHARNDQKNKLTQVGRLANSIVHDFNNLLCAIMGHAELLGFQTENAEQIQRRAKIILDACESGAGLTRQLLAFGGASKLIKQLVDPAREVQHTVNLYAPTGSDPTLALNFDGKFGLGNIEVDPSRLAMAVGNLITNAIDALNGVGKINVSVKRVKVPDTLVFCPAGSVLPGQDSVCISVQDDGIGFSEAALTKLLKPYFTTKSYGHGLGLTSVVNMLGEHSGALAVRNDPGALIAMYLPLSDRPESALTQLLANAVGCGEEIWMVDDDPHILEFSTVSLSASGFNPRAFRTGDDVVRHAKATDKMPDLLVLDIQGQPGGHATHTALKDLGIDVPVLWVSGAEAPKNADETPTSAFMRKPFTGSSLASQVGAHLKQSRQKPSF